MTPRRRPADGRPATAKRVPSEDSESSWASTPEVRKRMQRQQTRDTSAELAVRRILHRMGLRYRVDTAPLKTLRRRADIVFGPAKVAVFVDGCFWHGCPAHGSRTTHANPAYWSSKVAANKARDADTDSLLTAAGWTVIRAWEHEDPPGVAWAVAGAVAARRRLRLGEGQAAYAPQE